MMIKSLQKIICVIMLIAVLIPCVAGAQDDVQTSSRQTFSNEELAQMLAPVALYPDALLSQILMAATYPFEVVEAERWLTKNPYVTTNDALDEALQAKDWDVSVLSLCHYPKVLTMMSENLSWTARLGDAFTNQEQDVMDTVQELRGRARVAGNLSTTPEQKVIVEERYIRIEPIGPDYIYVPAYDPYVIYGSWWLPLFPPFPIILPGLVVAGPGIVFSPPFYVGFGVFGWSSFNWRERNVVIVDIDRTRRFNRRYHEYRGPDRRPWRPDYDRRYVRERRAGEIPRFRPPLKPLPDGRRLDRKPGDVPTPDKRRIPIDKPRLTDRDKRPDPPRLGDKDRKPDVRTPGVINRDKQPQGDKPGIERGKGPDSGAPSIMDRDKSKLQDRRVLDKDKPVIQPRIIDRNKLEQPDSRTIDKGQPVIRDRGKVEGIEPRNRPPLVDQKGVKGDQVRERDMKSDQRFAPRGERQDEPQRSIDRGDRGDRGDRQERGGRKQ